MLSSTIQKDKVKDEQRGCPMVQKAGWNDALVSSGTKKQTNSDS